MRHHRHWFAAAFILALSFAMPTRQADAKVIKVEVLRVEPAFAGRSFGAAGPYEKLVARLTIAVDPQDRHNSIVVDLDRAARGAGGLVEAVSDVIILRPVDPAKGNRGLLFEVVNRGRILGLTLLNDAAPASDLLKENEAGNGFLMTKGYTLVWAGWQGDLPSSERNPALALPVVPDVTGLSRQEIVFDNTTNPVSATLTYPAADLDPAQATLTVRTREADALCDNFGAALPFAKTREERLAARDPRPSLAERYPGPGDYAAAVTKSAQALVQAGLLLEADASRIIAEAKSTQ